MKTKNIYSYIIIALLLFSGCSDYLEEQPRSILTPSFFQTEEGLEYGLTSVYSGLRFEFGTEDGMNMTVPGTDEYTNGWTGTGDAARYYNVEPTSGMGATTWNRAFVYINTCNGIIEFGTEDQSIIVAEAKFLRALYYSIIAQTFGGVPLDLGSGELKFNQKAVTTSRRNTFEEVYDVIIQDLKDAVDVLPDIPATGHAGKGAAMHFLAKAYLTIHDYENAFTVAKELIDNRSTYGFDLEDNFADVNAEGNEYGSEVIFSVEHTDNLTFNESDVNPPDEAMKENRACFLFTPYWEFLAGKDDTRPFTSEARMIYQRPWSRFTPTYWLIYTCFADKENDSRFDASFRTVWYATIDEGIYTAGDTVFYIPCREVTEQERENSKARLFATSDIWVPETGDYRADLSFVTLFPHNRKFDDTHRQQYNYSSTRPYIVSKLSETYLIAAEAALMDNRMEDGLPYLNEIRERAAVGSKRELEDGIEVAKEAMRVSSYDLDFILDERSRELCGEQHRWFDLVRTGKLVERVREFNPGAGVNIQDHHMLRPIPQTQIDLLSEESREGYQNPGYN